jgi:hypothetical protein
VLVQFLASYTDYQRRMAVMKAISQTSTQVYFKKDYSEGGCPLIETLVAIIKSTEGPNRCPLDQRELAFNIIA